jgi:hypothetical protein
MRKPIAVTLTALLVAWLPACETNNPAKPEIVRHAGSAPIVQPALAGEPSSNGEANHPSIVGKSPKIVFDQVEFDFGQADSGDTVEHTYRFRNEGDSTLTIERVQASCGCTGALASVKDVPPGGAGEVMATFRTKGYQGPVTKGISVETNDPQNRMIRLALKGEVVTAVSVEPRSLNFGRINRNERPQPVKLTLKLREGKDLRIQSVSTDASAIVLTRVEELDSGAVYTVGLREKVPVGRLYGNIVIRTSGNKSPEIQVPFYGTVEGNVSVNPQFLSFAAIPPGQEVRRELTLVRTGKSSFTVQEIKPSAKELTTRLEPVKEGEEYRVTVSYHAGAEATGRISEKLVIQVMSTEKEVLEVPVYGSIARQKEQPAQAQP